MVATLVLRQLWVTLVATGESVTAATTDRGVEVGVDGEVRTYAGGRRRYVAREGQRQSFTATLRWLTLDEVDVLRGWAGQVVLIRDHRGQAFTAVYSTLGVKEWKAPTRYDVTLAAHTVTTTDGV